LTQPANKPKPKTKKQPKNKPKEPAARRLHFFYQTLFHQNTTAKIPKNQKSKIKILSPPKYKRFCIFIKAFLLEFIGLIG
jgi:hypothetical protein